MIGETFGNYRLVERLGSGAMGTVFLGEHERIARRAAIKVLAPQFAEDADVLRRFFDEARATSLILHPAIVEVLDCGVHPDRLRPYIVMQYVEGGTLAKHLEQTGPIVWPRACAIARRIAEGLDAAHRNRIVHRDVKPANVMLVAATSAAPADVKLLDFGVAKLLRDTQSKARTSPGQLLGTPEYMAPEQCAGEGSVDERTDIYALGCVLFEMLCGQPPFRAKRLSELILAHQWREAPAASTYTLLPPPLDALIAQMLSKQPADRPSDMAAVVQALGYVLDAESEEAALSIPAKRLAIPAAPPRPRLSRWLALSGGCLAVAGAGVAAHLVRSVLRTSHEDVPAQALSVLPPTLSEARGPTGAGPVWPTGPVPALPPSEPSPSPAVRAPPSAAAAPVDRRPPSPRRAREVHSPKIDTDGIVDF